MSDRLELIIGRPEAVYFNKIDGRGPCWAFEGEKKFVRWFRGYLLCVIADQRTGELFMAIDLETKELLYYEDKADNVIGTCFAFKRKDMCGILAILGCYDESQAKRARTNTVPFMDRDNAEIFYSKVSDLEEVFHCLAKQLEYVVGIDMLAHVQVRKPCDLSSACVMLFHAAFQYEAEHRLWYPYAELKPKSVTIANSCRAYAGLSLLQKGKEAHSISIRNNYVVDAFVCTSLIDMYLCRQFSSLDPRGRGSYQPGSIVMAHEDEEEEIGAYTWQVLGIG